MRGAHHSDVAKETRKNCHHKADFQGDGELFMKELEDQGLVVECPILEAKFHRKHCDYHLNHWRDQAKKSAVVRNTELNKFAREAYRDIYVRRVEACEKCENRK